MTYDAAQHEQNLRDLALIRDDPAWALTAVQKWRELGQEVQRLLGLNSGLTRDFNAMLVRNAKAEAELEEARGTITRQLALLWQVGLDIHEEKDPISDQEAIEHLLAIRNENPS